MFIFCAPNLVITEILWLYRASLPYSENLIIQMLWGLLYPSNLVEFLSTHNLAILVSWNMILILWTCPMSIKHVPWSWSYEHILILWRGLLRSCKKVKSSIYFKIRWYFIDFHWNTIFKWNAREYLFNYIIKEGL